MHSPELIDRIRELTTKGMSASEIGKELGMSRCAIIGVWYRNGIGRNGSGNGTGKKNRLQRTRAPMRHRARVYLYNAAINEQLRSGKPLSDSVSDLHDDDCRFIESDGNFCRIHRWHAKTPYCKTHSGICGRFYDP